MRTTKDFSFDDDYTPQGSSLEDQELSQQRWESGLRETIFDFAVGTLLLVYTFTHLDVMCDTPLIIYIGVVGLLWIFYGVEECLTARKVSSLMVDTFQIYEHEFATMRYADSRAMIVVTLFSIAWLIFGNVWYWTAAHCHGLRFTGIPVPAGYILAIDILAPGICVVALVARVAFGKPAARRALAWLGSANASLCEKYLDLGDEYEYDPIK